MKSYACVSKETENEIVIEKSRFIGFSKRVETEEEAREFIAKIKKLHPFATHNCYAFISDNGAIARFSDDGEPQGTAGMPILEVIKNKGLINTAVVVTRYFGGIKLGAGGLTRAYSSSASEVLLKAGKDEFIYSSVFALTLPYDLYGGFEKFKNTFKCKVLSTDFSGEVKISLAVPEEDDFSKRATEFFIGKAKTEKVRTEFVNYEI